MPEIRGRNGDPLISSLDTDVKQVLFLCGNTKNYQTEQKELRQQTER